jgi:hypothetical protein
MLGYGQQGPVHNDGMRLSGRDWHMELLPFSRGGSAKGRGSTLSDSTPINIKVG